MTPAGTASPTSVQLLNETRLLREVLSFGPQEASRRRACDWTGGEWAQTLEQARKFRALALLYGRVSRLPAPTPNLAEADREELRRAYLGQLSRNLKLFHRLKAIQNAFQAAGVQVILLKGAHLAQVVYADIGLRGMGDLDLLVPTSSLPAAAAALEGLGFAPARAYSIQTEIENHQHIPPYGADNVTVEVHWTLASPFSPWKVDLEGLWQRAQPLSPAAPGERACPLVLCPEDLLLHLSLHILQDEFINAFRRIFDIAQVLEHFKGQIDFISLQERANEWGLGKGLFLILYLAQELFQAAVDAGTLQVLKPEDFTPGIAAMACQRALTPFSVGPVLHPLVARLARRQPLEEKMRRVQMTLIPYPETMADRYGLEKGSKAVYLYYPLRWLQLLSVSARQLWQLALGDTTTREAAVAENLLSDWWMSPGTLEKAAATRQDAD